MIRNEQEARIHFARRTMKHIYLVQLAAIRLAEVYPKLTKGLLGNVVDHDRSKFLFSERQGYTRFWSQLSPEERESPEEKECFDRAWEHHKFHNRHHPGDDPGKMHLLDVFEMVCDWAAMGHELGGDLMDWARKAVPRMGLEKHREIICQAVGALRDGSWACEE